jgi:hypothetical protein
VPRESLEELPIRQLPDGPGVEERLEVLDEGALTVL